MMNKDYLIDRYNLKPHPEGGYYIESYRSEHIIKNSDNNNRNSSTAIYFLVESSNVSRLHRILSDEIWHFYYGSPLVIIEFDEDNNLYRKTILSNDFTLENATCQYVVKAGVWFGCYPMSNDADNLFSFVGCTVSPGFDFNDFTLASRKHLFKKFDYEYHSIIEKLTIGLP